MSTFPVGGNRGRLFSHKSIAKLERVLLGEGGKGKYPEEIPKAHEETNHNSSYRV
jgi:hypothetical protein